MAVSSFTTENASFRKLLGNGGRFSVPRFQRDYAWDIEQWEDLWLDVLAVVEGKETDHYLGYLVFHETEANDIRIIDGQQRLVTLSLLVLAVCQCLQQLVFDGIEPDDNQRRLTLLRRTYIGDEDVETLTYQTKLRLNRNNDGVFRDYLVELRPVPSRGVRQSSRLLGRAQKWLYSRVSETVEGGKGLVDFVSEMSKKVFFTVIYVNEEVKAYRLFETLNARGIQLSSADLLKNRMFSVVFEEHPTALPDLERRWDTLVDRIGEQKLVRFLRDHWLSKGRMVRQRDLFRALRVQLNDAGSTFAFLRALEEDVAPWLNLVEPEGADWHVDVRRKVRLLKVMQVRQPIPLLLAAHRAGQQIFERVLRAVVVIALRYNAIGRQAPSEMDGVFAQASLGLEEGRFDKPIHVIRALHTLYPSDESFRAAFATKGFKVSGRNKKLVRYLLHSLESESWDPQVDLSATNPTIEHLLPQNPGRGWEHVSDAEVERMVGRIGNLALLESTLNQNLKNAGWLKKREVLLTSTFPSTVTLAESYTTRWGASEIEARQAEQARMAVKIWRLEELS